MTYKLLPDHAMVANSATHCYSIVVKYNDGRLSFIRDKNRTKWKYRTAKKKVKELVQEQLSGNKWQEVWHFAVVMV